MPLYYKGFTLIELLAVILILGVIALIAIPIVTNIIRDAKEGALLRSAEGMGASAENYYQISSLKGNFTPTTFNGPDYSGLDFTGKKMANGKVTINTNGEVAIALYDSDKCAYKSYTEDTPSIIDNKTTNECLDMVTNEVVANPISVDINDNMVPIRYDGSKWVKADKTNTSNSWYNYDNKEWANAVLVSDSSRESYKTATAGTAVNEADILAYYVYVPRYRYKLFNANNSSIAVQEIDIEFETKNTTPSCGGNTCKEGRIYETGINDEWLTHPAFTFGDATDGYTELNGIWVGKFELTGDTTTPTIKPDAGPFVQSVSSLWTTIAKFKSDSKYGISASTMDAHMLKNMEWGAVAYLAQSKYGASTKITINNSNAHITGCAGNSVSEVQYAGCQNAYNTVNGFKASTTGNITGIYDMSGGADEYTMANMASSNANYQNHIMYPSNAGNIFGSYTDSNLPKKYYDIYDYDASSSATHARGLLGDATKETLVMFGNNGGSGWYSGYGGFPSAPNSWFLRGGYSNSNVNASIFSFNYSSGSASGNYSTRATLVQE